MAGRSEGKIPLAVPRSRRKDNIKITLNDILVKWEDRERCQLRSSGITVKNSVLHRVCSFDQFSNYQGSATIFHEFTGQKLDKIILSLQHILARCLSEFNPDTRNFTPFVGLFVLGVIPSERPSPTQDI